MILSQTLSNLFCQLSSLFTMRSIQWDRVAKIPAVVALNVMASPLKSMPLIPFGLRHWNTAWKNSRETKMLKVINNRIVWLMSHVEKCWTEFLKSEEYLLTVKNAVISWALIFIYSAALSLWDFVHFLSSSVLFFSKRVNTKFEKQIFRLFKGELCITHIFLCYHCGGRENLHLCGC